ncbi:hypothetical protein PM082_004094 [Marasmius tenuissimus]|nr:hypothetical protein PM082_004094 [Marasmius tenuissimus]
MSIPIPTATNPGPVPSCCWASNTGHASINLIVGVLAGVLAFLISLGAGWWLLKGRRQPLKAGMTRLPRKATIAPYPLPGEIEVGEKRSRLWEKRETGISVTSNESRNAEWSKGGSTSVQNGRHRTAQVTRPPRIVHQDVVIHDGPRGIEVQGVGVFHHTDSGWRLAVGRSSQTSLLEVPPSYSEAGQNRT